MKILEQRIGRLSNLLNRPILSGEWDTIMSFHYDCAFASELIPNLDDQVIDILSFMVGKSQKVPSNLPDHECFSMSYWLDFLRIDSDSGTRIGPGSLGSDFRKISHSHNGRTVYAISFRRSVHEDEFEFYYPFMDWLAPYCDTIGFVGYMRESLNLHPELIYLKNGKLYYLRLDQMPVNGMGEIWNEPLVSLLYGK